MSRPKKETIKLSENGVITEEAMVAYLQNELSAEEKQELEKLLKDDPFAQDAFEGLREAPDQAAAISSMTALKKKMYEKTGMKESTGLRIHWTNYAWAAVV